MQAQKWAYLRGPEGNPIRVDELPADVAMAGLSDDKYRSLASFGREIDYEQNALPFQEFYWGSWVRDAKPVDLAGWDRNDLDSYLKAAEDLTRAMTALPKNVAVDSGFTAADLGALDEWNEGKFDELSRPYPHDKPGKLAYALEYKPALGIMPLRRRPRGSGSEGTNRRESEHMSSHPAHLLLGASETNLEAAGKSPLTCGTDTFVATADFPTTSRSRPQLRRTHFPATPRRRSGRPANCGPSPAGRPTTAAQPSVNPSLAVSWPARTKTSSSCATRTAFPSEPRG